MYQKVLDTLVWWIPQIPLKIGIYTQETNLNNMGNHIIFQIKLYKNIRIKHSNNQTIYHQLQL